MQFHILLFMCIEISVLSMSSAYTALDGTGRNHLLAEMVLVLADAAIPGLDGLVFAHENLLGNLVEQSKG